MASTPDITGVSGRFATQQWWALITLVVFFLLIALSARWSRRRWLTIVGVDNRASTSRTVAFVWTLVVAYCFLAMVYVALAPTSTTNPLPVGHIPLGWVNAVFHQVDLSYLALLGAPVASVVGANVIVTSKLTSPNQTMQRRTNVGSPSIMDVVNDDAGNLDLVDLQLVVFNLIAASYVLTQFVDHPGQGLPAIPAGFAALTLGSSAFYLGDKAAGSNPPVIRSTTPSAAPGGLITITGENLCALSLADDDGTRVADTEVSFLPVSDTSLVPFDGVVKSVAPSRILVEVPATAPAGAQWQIRLVTNAGATATAPDPVVVDGQHASTEVRVLSIGTDRPATPK